MKAERWQQVEQIYHAARERSGSDRADFLARACAGDDELRKEVESLLMYEDQAENFIESPALDIAAKALAEEHERGLASGETINHYRIISPLGSGGMGEVYLAADTRLERKVALKFLPAHFTQDHRYLRRFEQEARAIAALSHPNVCMIHEVVQTVEGRHCIVMEFVDGTTLRQRILEGPMNLIEALEIATQVASALSAAHAIGIVHRDIKPENVMLRHDGYVKILDFGLAKLNESHDSLIDHEAATKMLNTAPGMVMGTVCYMSPEQARGLPVDARTDLWSLGVVLYEMVAGQQPFQGETPTDVIISLAGSEPPPLSQKVSDVPNELERILKKALAKDRDQRYSTAHDLLIDLKNLKRDLERGTADVERSKIAISQTHQTVSSDKLITRPSVPLIWTRRRMAIVGALLAVSIVAGIVVWRVFHRDSTRVPQTEIRSLAVLPMVNLSGDSAQDYFADGMTETLIAGLARIGALRVISRSAVMPYKGSTKPPKVIASELNVDAIVEGSVQRVGESATVKVQVIDSQNDHEIWTRTYRRDLRDIFALQNEVARDVTQAIQIKVTPQEQVRLTQARPTDPEAYDYFLRGRFYSSRQTKTDNETAIQMFDRAVAKDPQFAAAFAELAQACVWRFFLFTPNEKQWEERAFVAVEKALSLDPDSAEAHLARGRLLWTPANGFPHDKAIQEYLRAADLNPNLDEVHQQLAVVYGHVGLFDEAVQELQKTLAINPGNNLARYRFGEIDLFQGKYEEALAVLQNIPKEVNPQLVGHQRAWALFNLGRKQEAAATIEQFLRDDPEDAGGVFTSIQAVLAASAGQQREAESKIKSALERGKGFGAFHHTQHYVACAYLIMNKPDEAIKSLEAAAQNGFPCYPLFEHDANLNKLRNDQRFIAFMEKLRQQLEYYKKMVSRSA